MRNDQGTSLVYETRFVIISHHGRQTLKEKRSAFINWRYDEEPRMVYVPYGFIFRIHSGLWILGLKYLIDQIENINAFWSPSQRFFQHCDQMSIRSLGF
jgi:hypothetical protein